MPPLDILSIGRKELLTYGVEFRPAVVTSIRPGVRRMTVSLQGGTRLAARKVLLATGVVDALPRLPGFDDLYGTSIHHCPYCDGWENRDRPLAVYGRAAAASGLALSLLTWSRDLVVCTDGRRLGASTRARLVDAGIPARTERIVRLDGTRGRLERIVFARGPSLERDALFFTTGQGQRSPLAERLGCRLTKSGHVKCDRKGRTGVPHLFVAGDANGDTQFVVVAASEGAKAAVAINKELQEDDRT